MPASENLNCGGEKLSQCRLGAARVDGFGTAASFKPSPVGPNKSLDPE